MTKLEELKATSDAAYGTSEAAYATYTIACDDAWAAFRVADADYAAAWTAYQAELEKSIGNKPMNKLEELKAVENAQKKTNGADIL